MAAEVSYNSAWYTLGGAIAKKNVVSKAYTPFGEQIGEKTSGFGFNGEFYDALSGQIYLRARFYEPEMARFGQKDILLGGIANALSLNRYLYCNNDPVNLYDPSGLKAVTAPFDSGGGSVAAAKPVSQPPVQNHTQDINPALLYNPSYTAKATSVAVADAETAMLFAMRVAPNSFQAQEAMDAYQQTLKCAAIANVTHDSNIIKEAIQSARRAVYFANSSVNATGKPKTTSTTGSSSTSGNSYTPNTSSPTVQSSVQESGKCGGKAKFALFTNTTEEATSFQ